jgi:GxxExxY protein
MTSDVALTRQIIGAAFAVLNTLRPGLDEKLYERALTIELTRRGLRVEEQRQFPVHYCGQPIGLLVPDLVVDGRVIVETKVVTEFNDVHLAQLLGYLEITGLRTGLLLNFKHADLRIRRVGDDGVGFEAHAS